MHDPGRSLGSGQRCSAARPTSEEAGLGRCSWIERGGGGGAANAEAEALVLRRAGEASEVLDGGAGERGREWAREAMAVEDQGRRRRDELRRRRGQEVLRVGGARASGERRSGGQLEERRRAAGFGGRGSCARAGELHGSSTSALPGGARWRRRGGAGRWRRGSPAGQARRRRRHGRRAQGEGIGRLPGSDVCVWVTALEGERWDRVGERLGLR